MVTTEEVYAGRERLPDCARHRLRWIPYIRLGQVVRILGMTREPQDFPGPHQRGMNYKYTQAIAGRVRVSWSLLDTGPTTIG